MVSKYNYMEFSYIGDTVCSIFSRAGKFCLAHGLIQLTWDKWHQLFTNVSYNPTGPRSAIGRAPDS